MVKLTLDMLYKLIVTIKTASACRGPMFSNAFVLATWNGREVRTIKSATPTVIIIKSCNGAYAADFRMQVSELRGIQWI